MKINAQSGFTLLEVMVAMSIMIVAFSSTLAIQSSNLKSSRKAKQTNIVGMLAKNQLLQTELEIKGKKFTELPDESHGQFEPPYEEYQWFRKIKKIEFPQISMAAPKSEDSKDDSTGSDPVAEQMSQMVSKYLSNALKEITITVKWGEGKFEQKYAVSMYWVDLDTDLSFN